MSFLLSLAVGTTYGLYVFGKLGSPHNKYCLANQVEYFPLKYTNQEEMVALLLLPGVENVSKKLDTVIFYGFISNLVFVLFEIHRMSYKNKLKAMGHNGKSLYLGCLRFFVTITWLVQFSMLLIYRFSHTGKVCSGDYSDIMVPEGSST